MHGCKSDSHFAFTAASVISVNVQQIVVTCWTKKAFMDSK